MDTSKLITVVVWATIVLVLYELYKTLSSSTSQLGGGTLAEVNAGLTEDATNLTPPSLILATLPDTPTLPSSPITAYNVPGLDFNY